MLTEQEMKLAEALATGMPQAKALDAAGFDGKSRGYASLVVRKKMLNPLFVAHYQQAQVGLKNGQAADLTTPSSEGMRTFIVHKYKELIEKALSGKDRDKTGKPIYYNPTAARQALRDLAEMAQLFDKAPPTPQIDMGSIMSSIEAAEKRLSELRVVDDVSGSNGSTNS